MPLWCRDITTRKPLIYLGKPGFGGTDFPFVDTRDKPRGTAAQPLRSCSGSASGRIPRPSQVQSAEAASLTHQQRPPGHLMRRQLEPLRRVQLARGQRPALEGLAGQLVAQHQPQKLDGHERHRHGAADPVMYRPGADVQQLRDLGGVEAQRGVQGFELAALFHAGLWADRVAASLLPRRHLEIPRCILC